jgi:anti-anti-sigma factor
VDLELDVSQRPGVSRQVLSVRGEIDIATVAQLSQKLDSIENGESLILDLTATGFMDSSGLRLLMETHERFRASGRRLLIAVSGGPISRLLDVTGVREHLEVHETVEEADSVE